MFSKGGSGFVMKGAMRSERGCFQRVDAGFVMEGRVLIMFKVVIENDWGVWKDGIAMLMWIDPSLPHDPPINSF